MIDGASTPTVWVRTCDDCPFNHYVGGPDECKHPEAPRIVNEIDPEQRGRMFWCPLSHNPEVLVALHVASR